MHIETKRLLLRPLTRSDIDEFVRVHEHPEVTRFIWPVNRAEAERRLELIEREWLEREHGMFAVLDREDGRFLGRVGLKHWPQFGETEIGWVIRREAWGHGYATEAARACVEWGLATLEVPYLTAMIHRDNGASVAVARHLGMSPLRNDVLHGDPVVVYALEQSSGGEGASAQR